MTIFIAPRVIDRKPSEIIADIKAATDAVKKIFSKENVKVLYINPSNYEALRYLSIALHYMYISDATYFCPDWKNDYICRMIHEACEKFNIQRMEAYNEEGDRK